MAGVVQEDGREPLHGQCHHGRGSGRTGGMHGEPVMGAAAEPQRYVVHVPTLHELRVLQMGFSSFCTIDSLSLVILLLDGQIRQNGGHDTSGAATRDDGIRREVSHATLLAEEILVEDELPVDGPGGCGEDGVDGVGEDGWFSQVFQLGRVVASELLGGSRLDGLGIVHISESASRSNEDEESRVMSFDLQPLARC